MEYNDQVNNKMMAKGELASRQKRFSCGRRRKRAGRSSHSLFREQGVVPLCAPGEQGVGTFLAGAEEGNHNLLCRRGGEERVVEEFPPFLLGPLGESESSIACFLSCLCLKRDTRDGFFVGRKEETESRDQLKLTTSQGMMTRIHCADSQYFPLLTASQDTGTELWKHER